MIRSLPAPWPLSNYLQPTPPPPCYSPRRVCTHWFNHPVSIHSRFLHKNPQDPEAVPGGFLTDVNPVRWFILQLLFPVCLLSQGCSDIILLVGKTLAVRPDWTITVQWHMEVVHNNIWPMSINPLRANYCHTWHMENHPFLWRRICRVRRIQVCMARKGLTTHHTESCLKSFPASCFSSVLIFLFGNVTLVLRPAGGDPWVDRPQKYFFEGLCFFEWTWPFWTPLKGFREESVWFKLRKRRRKVAPFLTPLGAARAARSADWLKIDKWENPNFDSTGSRQLVRTLRYALTLSSDVTCTSTHVRVSLVSPLHACRWACYWKRNSRQR